MKALVFGAAYICIAVGGICGLALADDVRQYKAFKCQFPRYSGAVEESGKWTERAWASADNFELTFASVDLKEGKSQLIGNAGVADITVLPGYNSIHLLEMTSVGNLAVTTIYSTETDAKFLAVHSRHMGFSRPNSRFGSPLVSEYFGACSGLN